MNEAKQTTCKRCGRKLHNPQAIEIGMGATCWRKWQKENQKKAVEDETIKTAMKEILGKFLDDMYSYYMEVGFIPLDKLHQCRRIYDCYHNLGGNGTGTTQINRLEQLPNAKQLQ